MGIRAVSRTRANTKEHHPWNSSDALPFLEQEHPSIVSTVGRSGLLQSTIVTAGPREGGMAFVVRGSTIKLANLKRDDRCTVLVVKPDWSRFATIEGRV